MCSSSPSLLEAELGQVLLVPCNMLAYPQVNVLLLLLQLFLFLLAHLLLFLLLQPPRTLSSTTGPWPAPWPASLSPCPSPTTAPPQGRGAVSWLSLSLGATRNSRGRVNLNCFSEHDYGSLECWGENSEGSSSSPCTVSVHRPGEQDDESTLTPRN